MESRDRKPIQYVSDQTAIQLPVVVLIDEGSASSAEIVAGALRDSAQIPLIGQKTFGKGVSQRVIYFSDDSLIKYTYSEIVNPSGFRYHGVGLTPDEDVGLPIYARYPVLQLKETYQLGDRSEEISLAQKYLEALAFNPGRSDGVFDERTLEAVKRMQARANLEQTGVLEESSALAMVDMLRNLLRDNDTQFIKGVEMLKERIEP